MSPWSRRKEETVEREERKKERAQRELSAGTLLQSVPGLASLSIAIHETRPDGVVSDTHYTRRVVVEHAPALFEIPCSYRDCTDGSYDLTREILAALEAGKTAFEGQQRCRGRCGDLDCTRVLHFVGTATYQEGYVPRKDDTGGRGLNRVIR